MDQDKFNRRTNQFKGTIIFGSRHVEKPPDWLEQNVDDVVKAESLNRLASSLDGPRRGTGAPRIPANAQEEEQMRTKSKTSEDDPEEMTRPCSMEDFIELAEALLCFHAWYKLGSPKVGPDGIIETTSIRGSVSRMLAMI